MIIFAIIIKLQQDVLRDDLILYQSSSIHKLFQNNTGLHQVMLVFENNALKEKEMENRWI